MSGDPTARTLQLLSLLQTHRLWRGSELADRLEVSERTVRRDVDRLRDLGYSVDATSGVDGGYRLAAGAHLPPLVLDDEEAVAIAVGLREAAKAVVDGIEDASLRALAKLEQVLPHHLRRRVSAIHASVTHLQWGSGGDDVVDAEALAVLAQACRDHEEARFEYRRRDGDDSSRLVEPHKLVTAGRRWYLVAWDLRRADWRTFRLDRLTGARLAGGRFSPRMIPGGDAAAFVASSLGAMPRAHHATLRVGAPAEALNDVLRWADHEVLDDAATHCTIRLRADTMDWLVLPILTLALHADVSKIEPTEVAERVGQIVRHLAQPRSFRSSSGTGQTSRP